MDDTSDISDSNTVQASHFRQHHSSLLCVHDPELDHWKTGQTIRGDWTHTRRHLRSNSLESLESREEDRGPGDLK